jgi:DNA-binding response OmpR family regulator
MSTVSARRILVAEDEEDVCRLVTTALEKAGFETLEAADGKSALAAAKDRRPDLIVLDLMLPQLSGLEVCKALKMAPETRSIPIIMLTAKAEEVDRILGLELGADDYVTKPFSPRELTLRVQSVLRRGERVEEEVQVRYGSILLDKGRFEVSVDGRAINTTATEFNLLRILIERRGRVQSRTMLLNDVWGYNSSTDTRTVDTHIARLREKLGPAGHYIETARGFGYRMAGGND